ncbi:MAG: hypothetical protein GXY05_16650 [Clostridiales bacterium]|nr:hypothetical protein [Clostridiales bacterium]
MNSDGDVNVTFENNGPSEAAFKPAMSLRATLLGEEGGGSGDPDGGQTGGGGQTVSESGSNGIVPVKLTQAATRMDVTVPMSLPVTMDAAGNITVSNNVGIYNDSFGPVEIVSTTLTGANGWSLVTYGTDFAKLHVGAKQFAFSINGNAVSAAGAVNDGIGVIYGGASKGFTYDAKVAAQNIAVDELKIADAVFVVGWYAAA